MIGRFIDLFKPDALEKRGDEVARRGRGLKAVALIATLASLGCAAMLGLRVPGLFDGTVEGLVAANWHVLGTALALGAAYWGWAAFSQGRRLERTGHKLRDRAALQRRIEESP